MYSNSSSRNGKQIVCVEAKEVCPCCFMDTHSLLQCPWLYTKCPQRGCTDTTKVKESIPEKIRYLECEYAKCPGEAQCLEDAMKDAIKQEKVDELCKNFKLKGKVEFECTKGILCETEGCNFFMEMHRSSAKKTYGKRYWKYLVCETVAWLNKCCYNLV